MHARLAAALLAVMLAACGGEGKGPGPGTGPGSDSGSGGVSDPVDPPAAALATDDAVLAAVYEHEIAAAHPTAAEALCLRVRTGSAVGDPSPALLAAIQAGHPTAIGGSACGGGGPSPVVVTATSAAGIVFDIGPVTWGPDPGVALVPGGGGQRGGSSGIREVQYRVETKAGAYAVTDERVTMQN